MKSPWKKKTTENRSMNKTKTLILNQDQVKTAINYLILSKSTSASYEDYLKVNEIIDLLENTSYNEDISI